MVNRVSLSYDLSTVGKLLVLCSLGLEIIVFTSTSCFVFIVKCQTSGPCGKRIRSLADKETCANYETVIQIFE